MNEFNLFDSLCFLLAVGVVWRTVAQVKSTAAVLMHESERNWKFILLGDQYFYRHCHYNNLRKKISFSSLLIVSAAIGMIGCGWWSLTVFGRFILLLMAFFLPVLLVLSVRVFVVLAFYLGRLPSLIVRFFEEQKFKKEAALS